MSASGPSGPLVSFYFDPVCSKLHDLIRACICNALVLNVNAPFKVILNVSAKQQRLDIITGFQQALEIMENLKNH